MFNIANYYRNTNQNCNEILSHTSQNGYHQKFTNNKHWRGCGEKGILLHCWWECKLVQPLWRTAWRFLKKLKIEQSHSWAYIWRKSWLKRIYASLWSSQYCLQQPRHEPKCPSTDKWVKNVVHIYNGILHNYKKNEIMPFTTTWMDLRIIILS